jgi:plastocyanin
MKVIPRGLRSTAIAAIVVAVAGFAGNPGGSGPAHRAPPGKTIEVQMLGDAKGYRFSPAKITIQRGDQVRFTLVSGPPHNVVFWSDSIPKGAAARLSKSMPNAVGPLTGPFFMNVGDKYVVSFAGLPAGTYRYYCAPHLALGMSGAIVVK